MKDKLYIEELEAIIYDIFYLLDYDDIMNTIKFCDLSTERKKEIVKLIQEVMHNYENIH